MPIDLGQFKKKEGKIEIIPDSQEEKKPKLESKIRKTPIISKPDLHILTEENLIIFIKQTRKTKSYELKHRFYNNSSYEIQQLVNILFQKGLLEKNRNGWISLRG